MFETQEQRIVIVISIVAIIVYGLTTWGTFVDNSALMALVWMIMNVLIVASLALLWISKGK